MLNVKHQLFERVPIKAERARYPMFVDHSQIQADAGYAVNTRILQAGGRALSNVNERFRRKRAARYKLHAQPASKLERDFRNFADSKSIKTITKQK